MTATTWVPAPANSPFPIQNLPYGVVSHERSGLAACPAVAIGASALPLATLAATGLLPSASPGPNDPFSAPTLNPLMATGRAYWQELRTRLTELLSDPAHRPAVEPLLVPLQEVQMHLPIEVADYVDFYASEQHASNIGKIFRPGSEPLTPNWKHLPIGYHGRAGTVAVSGTDVVRPCGQRKAPDDSAPSFGPSIRLDIEAEVGFVVGVGTAIGSTVATTAVRDHVFGVVLVNDWSARDIQAWEYVPLGPFLGKSFLTSISPWVVPLDALEAAMITPIRQDPQPLPYLRDAQWGLDLALEVRLNDELVSRPPFRDLYWTPAQQLAHTTVNGAAVRTGDLFASGTVSGAERDQRGSLIELSWNGTEPLTLADGSTRSFLEDGDTVSISATAPGVDGVRIGFGEVVGTVRQARR